MGDQQIPPIGNRVVLLGASNLTLGLPLIIQNLQAGLTGTIDVQAALGHGRSYGNSSRVLFRELPGIVGCELWNRCEATAEPAGKMLALFTDVGNDLMYGASVSHIVEWIEVCLKRLSQMRCEIVGTLLPIASVEQLSAWRFTLMRSILFPGKQVRLSVLLQQARELNNRLEELGEKYNVHLLEPPNEWYGFDPIHIRFSRRAEAWQQILDGWPSYRRPKDPVRASLATHFRVWNARPAERRFFGRQQRATQPVLQLGTMSVSLY